MKLSEDNLGTLQIASMNAVQHEARKASDMTKSARRAATNRAAEVLYVALVAWANSGQAPNAFIFSTTKKALAAMVMEQSWCGAPSSDYRKELRFLVASGLLTVADERSGKGYKVNAVRVLEAGATRLREMIAGKVEDAIAEGMSENEANRHSEGLGGYVMALEYDRLAEKIRHLFP